VHVLDQDVDGGDHPTVGSSDEGSVVTGAEEHGGRQREPGGHGRDQPELAKIPCGRFRHECKPCTRATPTSSTRLTREGASADAREGHDMAVQAYILIQTEVGKAASVASAISQLDGVANAEDVTGPYDVIVRAEAKNVDDLGKLVVAKIQGVEGITRTLTCPVVHL
jgi:hypothetical protein